jgi:hypothetical protein
MPVSCHHTGMLANESLDNRKTSQKWRSGKARMEKLTAEERSNLASKAAASRWHGAEQVILTEFGGNLKIGEKEVPCAVLPDGTRVVSERGLIKAFGGKRGGSHWQRLKADPDGAILPAIISAHNLRPFIDSKPELKDALAQRYLYRIKRHGAKAAYGRRADLFPKICDVFLRARDVGALAPSQRDLAIAADILMRGLAEVGITALIDEATGYQNVRDRLALQEILQQFIGTELAKWERRFPPTFYQEIFRLKGWKYDAESTRRPMLMAHITADVIYRRLAPGVLTELRRLTPPDTNGRRKTKLHQWLTEDVGHPALNRQIDHAILLGKASDDWDAFMRLLDRAAPRYGDTLPLDFGS